MEKDLLIKMLDAGFTAEEIKKIMPENLAEEEQPAGAGGGSSDKEEGAADGARQGGASSNDDGIRAMLEGIKKEINEQLEDIKKFQQEINVKTFDTDSPFKTQLTAKDAFNQIYNPPMYFDDEEGEK